MKSPSNQPIPRRSRKAMQSLICCAIASCIQSSFAAGYPAATYKGPAASGNYDATGRNGVAIDMVVIHTTEGSTAQGALDRFLDASSGASAHYIIDANGVIWEVVYDELTAYHDGNLAYNRRSIGI